MRFSWNSLKQFIDLENINFDELMNQLTLAGFEIDEIYHNTEIEDIIIDLNITANRQDVLSVLGLAREISSLINKKLIIDNYNFEKDIAKQQINSNILKIDQDTNISELRINIIHSLKHQNSPEWIKKYLSNFDIQCTNLISDIQKYIKIKWGQDIHLIDISEIYKNNINEDSIEITTNNTIKNISNYNKIFQPISKEYLVYNNVKLITLGNTINQNFHFNHKISKILLCGYTYNNDTSKSLELIPYTNINDNKGHYITNDELYLKYAYQEALMIISIVTQGITSKLYYYAKNIITLNNTISINKKIIQQTLGPLKNSSYKYLNTQKIKDILNQLKLNPEYDYYTKTFKITIPKYRYKDLYRDIDIIEEIGRIYGYENFLDRLPSKHKQGFISEKYHLINRIRQIFRDIGLHEVINSSLTKKNKLIKSNIEDISVYNPLLEEQSILRHNLIEDLICNKAYNYRQQNRNIEIFEIGRVFNQSLSEKQYHEEIHLAGIMGNKNFIQTSWGGKSYDLTWFHAKGTIEHLFEKLQISIYWDSINLNNQNQNLELFNYCYNPKKTAYIKTINNNIIIGILGQITNKLSKHLYDNQPIYMFEININILQKYIKYQQHLEYTFSKYSIYPSVSRDISIQISKNITLSKIKTYIYQTNPSLIENIDIFNEYYDRKNNKRYIGIRITYRSNDKTLNNNDIENIDKTIRNILHSINT